MKDRVYLIMPRRDDRTIPIVQKTVHDKIFYTPKDARQFRDNIKDTNLAKYFGIFEALIEIEGEV